MPAPDMTASRCKNSAARLIDWYWAAGVKRKRNETLSPATWLGKAYSIAKQTSKVAAQPDGTRKTMAIWGPSQSGKSTLLSGFLDRPVGDYSSALQWRSDKNVMFVGADQRIGLRLNPQNYGGDASGCVTRFCLAGQVESDDYPVEFIFADPDQLLEAIAIGYMTECEYESGFIAWDADQITKVLNAVPKRGGIAERENFELLHDFTLVVDDLILSRWPSEHVSYQ